MAVREGLVCPQQPPWNFLSPSGYQGRIGLVPLFALRRCSSMPYLLLRCRGKLTSVRRTQVCVGLTAIFAGLKERLQISEPLFRAAVVRNFVQFRRFVSTRHGHRASFSPGDF